jgi:hypothetical protein
MDRDTNRVLRHKYLLVSAYNKNFYCKLSGSGQPGNLWYTFHFGGKSRYCITISVIGANPTEAYMDRVEYDAQCIKDGPLEKGGGTAKLLSIALWVLVTFFPTLQKIKFLDDSHIECIQGSTLKKMNLASDYILKYGMTWYERIFHATLPDSVKSAYQNSLAVLDNPLDDFNLQVNRLPRLEKYRNIYVASTTPKDFFEHLRKQYGSKYCEEVCDWIHMYVRLLNIEWYNSMWVIPAETVTKPQGFSMKQVQNPMQGGRYTRKRRQILHYEGNSIGVYDGTYI